MSVTLSLTDLANLQNETTAVNAINDNNAAITTAFQNVLALDGTLPNSMEAPLDMNSNPILNLPAPTNMSSPLRLIDVSLLNGGGTISAFTLPAGGTTGQFLIKNTDDNYDSSWSSRVADLIVTDSFSAPGILTTSVLNGLSITLGTTSLSFGQTYPTLSGPITFSGAIVHQSTTNLQAALTYGGVTLSNSVTGTGGMVLSANPTITGTLSFGTLSPTSLGASTATVTGLAHNASPVSSSDYIPYYSSANNAINKITVSELISSTTAGVSSIGGSTGVITLGGDLSISSNTIKDSFTTGDVKPTFKQTADSGWLMMADQTIGDASSGANFASSTAQALFTLFYASPFTDTWVPILTSTGTSTTRSAQGTAAAAWAAHCRMVLPKVLGRVLGAAGVGSGLTSFVCAETAGSNNHALTASEAPVLSYTSNSSVNDPGHNHNNNGIGGVTTINTYQGGGGGNLGIVNYGPLTVNSNTTGISVNTSTSSNAGGGSHTNMQPSFFLNIMVKL